MASFDDSLGTRRRVSFPQLQTMWEYLNVHREIATGYNKSAEDREHSKQMWESIAKELNSHEDGAVKDWRGWSTYWTDYKAKLKKKASASGDTPPLSDHEKKYLSLLSGPRSSKGLPNKKVKPKTSPSRRSSPVLRIIPVSPVPVSKLQKSTSAQQDPLFVKEPHLVEEALIAEDLEIVQEPEIQKTRIAEEPQIKEETNSNVRGVKSGFKRRRRIRETHISQEEARHTLIDISRERLDVERSNNQILQRMLNVLQRLADQHERILSSPQLRDEDMS